MGLGHSRRNRGGGGTGTQRPLECEILTLTLWALHGKNEVKSRWSPPPPGRSRSAATDLGPIRPAVRDRLGPRLCSREGRLSLPPLSLATSLSPKPFTEKRNLPPPDQVDEGHAWPAAIDSLATNHSPCQERGIGGGGGAVGSTCPPNLEAVGAPPI